MEPSSDEPVDARIAPTARAFGTVVSLYETGRPEYPAEAVRFVVDALGLRPGSRVLDLAAGTGKFTRALVPYRFDLVAVEPTPAMRLEFALRVPAVPVLDGTAEAIPVPAGSLDAVVAAQAFHWFRPEAALDEVARVLRPGGGLGILANHRDERTPWVAELSRIIYGHRGVGTPSIRDRAWRDALARHPAFAPVAERTFDHVHRTDREGIVARVLSVSYIAALTGEARGRVAADVRALLDRDPETAGRTTLGLPYRTEVSLARRSPRAGGRAPTGQTARASHEAR